MYTVQISKYAVRDNRERLTQTRTSLLPPTNSDLPAAQSQQ